jgi:thioredoxin 1
LTEAERLKAAHCARAGLASHSRFSAGVSRWVFPCVRAASRCDAVRAFNRISKHRITTARTRASSAPPAGGPTNSQEYFRVTSDKSEQIVHISDASFEENVVKARGPVLIDFWAEWCGPCKAIAPMLSELAEEYRDKVTIVKLNVDENPKTSQRFNVRSIPTLILFKNGQVEGQKVGAPRKSDLVAFLDSKL